jgi:hypothetical protein
MGFVHPPSGLAPLPEQANKIQITETFSTTKQLKKN